MVGEEENKFRSLKLKFALSDTYDLAKESSWPHYIRHIAYGSKFRWATLDRIYLPLDSSWYEAVESINHQADYTLSDHMLVTIALALGGRFPRGIKFRTYFRFDAHLMAQPDVNQTLRPLWDLETKEMEDPVLAYCKGWAAMRKYMKVKQREQAIQISLIDELGKKLKACHEALPPNPSGDAPTRYFLGLHRKQIAQQHFSKLWLPDGSETTCKTAIMKEAFRVFSALYTSKNRTDETLRDTRFINSKLTNRISDVQRRMLVKLPSANEIHDSLYSFPLGKAPGIDGTCDEALQAVWEFIGPTYLKVVEQFWSLGDRIKPLTFGNHAVADFSLFAVMGVYLDLDEDSFKTLRGLLSFFESASGARLNLQKSFALVIGLHTEPPHWLRRMGCGIMEHRKLYRYLGAPISSGLTHDQLISFCLDRLVSRLNLWSNKILSFEGRVVLVKHILLTIPIFYLSTIGITKKVAKGVEAIARRFLWDRTEEGKNKRGLIPWPALKRGKRHGGLGFRDVWRQSVALFSKHMGDYMANTDKAQWHKLLSAFIYGQRAKRRQNVIRGCYHAQELLLLKRSTHPGKSFMAKSLVSAWMLTSKDLLWSPVKALIPIT
ncbi:hypothetical protein R1flu_010308 [Riccia fluitans]|uniref:Uncharacterized protein n=1 Tax=Riccia fluitans TaxID=41844 RepID=A0ABD1Z4Y6_9MARC